MAATRVKLNKAAARQVMRSDGVLAELARRGERIAAAAGPGHEVQKHKGRNRARVTVRTATWPARYHEATERRLTRAIRAGS